MKSEDLKFIKILKENIAWFVTAIGIVTGIFSGVFALGYTFENKLKSIYYQVDFSLYQISFDFYQIILWFILLFLCWEIVLSLRKSVNFLFHKCFKKEKMKIPVLDFLITVFFLFLLILFFWINWVSSLYLFLIIIFYYFLTQFILLFFKGLNKFTDIEIDRTTNLREEFLHYIKVFSFLICIEFILFFVSVTYDFYNKKDYFVIEQDEQIEIVVESYADYYITKKAKIEDKKLIIISNSQNVRSTFNTIVSKKNFEDIFFE